MFRPDHGMHEKRSGPHCKGCTRPECEGMTEDLSRVFPEERCKVGSADDDGIGVYIGHERCGCRSWRCDGCQHDCGWGRSDHYMRESKGSRIVDSKTSKISLAEDVDMVSANLNAMEIGSVLLDGNREIQSGIESRAAKIAFALLGG